jgi:hypothetical protein
LQADADGRLTYAAASRSAGMALFTGTVAPFIRGPYQALRLQLAAAALLFVLIGILLIQGIGRAVIRDQAAPQPR